MLQAEGANGRSPRWRKQARKLGLQSLRSPALVAVQVMFGDGQFGNVGRSQFQVGDHPRPTDHQVGTQA